MVKRSVSIIDNTPYVVGSSPLPRQKIVPQQGSDFFQAEPMVIGKGDHYV